MTCQGSYGTVLNALSDPDYLILIVQLTILHAELLARACNHAKRLEESLDLDTSESPGCAEHVPLKAVRQPADRDSQKSFSLEWGYS
jgi:hypothetical protein